jgi:hypothetical protein
MRFVAQFVWFWYDFVVGDDWRIAVGVAATIAVVFALAHRGVNAWWLLPLATILQLTVSVVHEARRHPKQQCTGDIEPGGTP